MNDTIVCGAHSNAISAFVSVGDHGEWIRTIAKRASKATPKHEFHTIRYCSGSVLLLYILFCCEVEMLTRLKPLKTI